MQAPLWQFWIDWAVRALGTVATFFAVFVALFGSWLRDRIWPPRLTLALVSDEGYPSYLLQFLDKMSGQPPHQTSGFWYFVRVENRTRWNPVTELYIFLLSVERTDAAGDFKPDWVGRAPLHWRSEPNPQPKKIGHSFDCDLCHILKEPLQVRLGSLIAGQAPDCFIEPFRIAITLQARGVEADSDEVRVEISWNGKWADSKDEMKRHLVVRVVPRGSFGSKRPAIAGAKVP